MAWREGVAKREEVTRRGGAFDRLGRERCARGEKEKQKQREGARVSKRANEGFVKRAVCEEQSGSRGVLGVASKRETKAS